MNDAELHKKLKEISSDESKRFQLIDGMKNQLPFFGWFWREFNWRIVPLGYNYEDNVIAIMAKNKWYYPEYNCNEHESKKIRDICQDICEEYSKEKVMMLTSFLQEIGNSSKWRLADRKAIDDLTMREFKEGKRLFMMSDGTTLTLDQFIEKCKKEQKE